LRQDDLVLGNVSRIVPWKGLDYAVEIFGSLIKIFPTLKLVIVGDARTPSEQGYKRTPAEESAPTRAGRGHQVSRLGAGPGPLLRGF
jgi:glycosyltransferase involved in cell wall biosynthesis